MLDDDNATTTSQGSTPGGPEQGAASPEAADAPATQSGEAAKPVVKKTTRKAAAKRTTKKAAATDVSAATAPETAAGEPETAAGADTETTPKKKATARRATTKKAAAAPRAAAAPAPESSPEADGQTEADAPAASPRKRASRSRAKAAAPVDETPEAGADDPATGQAPGAVLFQTPASGAVTRRTRKSAASRKAGPADAAPAEPGAPEPVDAEAAATDPAVPAAEETEGARPKRTRSRATGARKGAAAKKAAAADPDEVVDEDLAEGSAGDVTDVEAQPDAPSTEDVPAEEPADDESADDESAGEEPAGDDGEDADAGDGTPSRRRRRRGGRRRRKSGDGAGNGSDESADEATTDSAEADTASGAGDGAGEGSSRRRRRRRRAGDEGPDASDDDANSVTRVRKTRNAEDQITAVTGSTRLEAKKQRRREGREAGRRRAPIVSEAEFLARRESVDRTMVVRQRDDLTQIAVLEDRVLVEHYVARESQTSLIGNVYLGRVQNVLPSMEAAFIDIGKGRNAVLYAGEVNWSALGHKEGQPRKIESVLSSGQSVLVQVTKDPVGHKGARLTSQVSLAGRFLVYVPDGTTSGISRKLPDTERNRLKTLLKEIVPDSAGVIVRTAAEGASEDELTRDVERLKARWEDIEKKAKGSAPQLLYGEPDLTLKVVRDLFTEDFAKLLIEGDDAWETVRGYVEHVAPDLVDRVQRFEPDDSGRDVFAAHRIEEQIHKGLDRKVWLPSGGSLVIDRTEAMTVVDVNTGKFTGSGGNLEETVTKNNLEAAEEIVRQLRLRDIGGIIVVDFIDMVLESNRDLVVRRLVECLGRDRTRHQVAEVTSLGLVQMTRKRIGTGLLESFSENCEHCQGRGVVIKDAPVDPSRSEDDEGRRGGRRGKGRRGGGGNGNDSPSTQQAPPTPKDVAAMARADRQAAAAQESAEPAAPDEAASEEAAPVESSVESEVEAQPARSGRGRSGRGRSRSTQAEPNQAEPDAEAQAEPTQTEPTQTEPTQTEPDQAEPTPAEPTPAEPTQTEPTQTEPTQTEPDPEAGASGEPSEREQSAPTKPQVVTRTRRRAASRPAGPPAASDVTAGATLVELDGASAEPVADGTVDSEPPHVEHVPVKKRGSRKR